MEAFLFFDLLSHPYPHPRRKRLMPMQIKIRIRALSQLLCLCACMLSFLPALSASEGAAAEAAHLKRFPAMETQGLEDGSLVRVLEDFYQANYGGADNWATVESIRFDGQLHRPGGSLPFTAYKKKPNYCKIIIRLGAERRVILSYDGEDAWQLDTGAADARPRAMSEEEALNFIRSAPTGSHLLHPTLPGKTITLGSTVEVDGAMCREVHVTLSGGMSITYVLNVGNHAERQQISTNAVNGDREVTTHNTYEKIQGILFPTESILRVDGEEIHRVEIEEITLNAGLMSWMFERPRVESTP
jgi:hypothetical protein